MRFFSRYFRCIAYDARGFPPSDIPEDGARYSQAIARDDAVAVLDHLKIDKAHVCGLSMGGFAALHVGIAYPKRVRSLVIGGCGYGAEPDKKANFQAECEAAAASFESNWAEASKKYAIGPTRVQYQAKDPRGWAEFAKMLGEHSGLGSALTMLHVQLARPTLWEMEADLTMLQVPLLIIVGDEDEACLDGSLLVKRRAPQAALCVIPRAGHTITSEEPAAVNAALAELFAAAEAGRWMAHKPVG